MAFRKNDIKPLDFDDVAIGTTEEELERITQTWAKDFRTLIFNQIDETPYAALFSENDSTRPNVPINTILSLLILRKSTGRRTRKP